VGRGGGLAIGMIEVKSGNSELRPGTLKTISNSLQLALRPMDRVFRFDANTFAVSIHYQKPDDFNLDMFQRLVDNVKRHTRQTSDQGKQLKMLVGMWQGHDLDPAPTAEEIIALVLKDMHQS